MKTREVFLFLLSAAVIWSLPIPSIVQAQNGQDYYNQRIKIIEECGKDEACLRSAEKEARERNRKTQDFLNDKTNTLESDNEFLDDTDWDSPDLFLDINDKRIAKMSLDELVNELTKTKFFRELDQAKVSLDSSSRCGLDRKRALETKDALDMLNDQVKNKTTENYGEQARELKKANTKALQTYEACYERYLPGYPLLRENYVLTRDTHTSEYNKLLDSFKDVPDLDAYVMKLEKALEDRTGSGVCSDGSPCLSPGVIGAVAYIHETVEVLRASESSSWKPVQAGYELQLRDELRTGPGARARIVFADRYQEGNAGPTVVNIGSETHVQMEKFEYSFSKPTKRTGIIALIRGTLRVFAKGWRNGSLFSVKPGTTVCGIRGTEVAIRYNPDTGASDYHLAHGDAYIETAGKRAPLRAGTSRTLAHGVLSAEQHLGKNEWSKILSTTGDGFAETLTRANASYSELLVPKTFGGVTKPQVIIGDSEIKVAEEAAEKFIKALQSNNETLLDASVDGAQKNMLKKNRQNQPLKKWLDGNKQRPTHFHIKCTLCEGNICETLAYLETEGDFPGAGKDILFESRNVGNVSGVWRVTATHVEKKRISAFRLKPAICRE